MSSLTYLQLSDNVFTGSLDALFPADASDQPIFPNLTTLNLANNDLSGQIPESRLRRMPNLKQLILHGNPDLSGSLNEMCKGNVISQIDSSSSAARGSRRPTRSLWATASSGG